MKKKRNGRSSLRLRFILICMSQLVLVAALSELAGWVFRHWFGVTPELPIFVWAMVFSGTIGVAVTNHMTKMLIDPIAKLRSAMREVADGDFKVEAKCESRIQDVQDIYDSFNSMVRELSTTETLQTDFISDVSHEFKTPINAIEGYASLLEGEPSPEEQRAYVEKILFNTRRLSALTGNILLLSKLSNQSILPQKTQFRLDEQIRQAIVALEQKWSEKELGFEVARQMNIFVYWLKTVSRWPSSRKVSVYSCLGQTIPICGFSFFSQPAAPPVRTKPQSLSPDQKTTRSLNPCSRTSSIRCSF